MFYFVKFEVWWAFEAELQPAINPKFSPLSLSAEHAHGIMGHLTLEVFRETKKTSDRRPR